MKFIVIAMIVAIIGSLGSALMQLSKQVKSKSMVRILATRVILSIALFAALMIMYKMGIIRNHIL
ncbi:putative DUF2909 domain protein [Candidatus Ichthyocystis hellenicum]|uniref:Putative DUF2909 domain protein n=2 Tax=Candidatus Ichthyocystis hellenicum TaxID=1561003 RepID=A0A0S4LZM1_9BURK|nr:putative DUF2909 domain protein [Candidatus Ichthyocystis hellenicum]